MRTAKSRANAVVILSILVGGLSQRLLEGEYFVDQFHSAREIGACNVDRDEFVKGDRFA
jgi:hypothetical protein